MPSDTMYNDRYYNIMLSVKILKQKVPFILLFLTCILVLPVNAQPRQFFNNPPPPPTQTKPVQTQDTSSTGDGKTTGGEGSAGNTQLTRPNVPLYDPSMDNRLQSPASGDEIGLFGQGIKEVEEKMRFLGAKNHSYAFGKYSRMILSVYLITMYFDKDRRLGSVEISPQPPFDAIGPEARKFFLETFFAGADVSSFDIKIARDRLELRYLPKK